MYRREFKPAERWKSTVHWLSYFLHLGSDRIYFWKFNGARHRVKIISRGMKGTAMNLRCGSERMENEMTLKGDVF
jgi:hypothetical protein